MKTKLEIYNAALRLCQERKLIALTDNTEPRRLLDAAWGSDTDSSAIKYCLEMGQWTFATRTLQVDFDPNVSPEFGYRYAFEQPDDMVKVAGVFQDEMCNVPLLDYSDERRYWFSSLDRIWVKAISSLPEYGGDLSLWPETFAKMVEAYLANEIVGNLTHGGPGKMQMVAENWRMAKLNAKSNDAMNKPTVILPTGKWNTARGGGRNYERSYAR